MGAITDENSKSLSITLDFLTPNTWYEATLYRDAENADWKTNPDAYVIEKRKVNHKSRLKLYLAAGGGCAMSIREVN